MFCLRNVSASVPSQSSPLLPSTTPVFLRNAYGAPWTFGSLDTVFVNWAQCFHSTGTGKRTSLFFRP